MAYSYDRRTADQRFDSLFDLESYLRYHQKDWREGKSRKGASWVAFRKRIGGIWMELGWIKQSSFLTVSPTSPPKGVSTEAWWEATTHTFDNVRGVSLSEIERKAAEMAKAHRAMTPKRETKDTSGYSYTPHAQRSRDVEPFTGKEAYKAWLKDVQEYILNKVNEMHQRGTAPTSKGLISETFWEYPLRGMDERGARRAISRLLNAMDKQGLIVKGGERHNPTWFKE